jgi:HAE1 family hydrophobic/amphiphilic exporter-1
MNLPEFSVRRPVTIAMMICIIVVLGAYSLMNLGLELFPDLTYPVISVLTTYQGASPEDVEQMVTKTIEENIATISRVKSVKSISYEGVSTVMTEFEWGTNLDFAAQDIRDRIAIIKGFLPEDIQEPLVLKYDISMMPILVMAVAGMEDTEEMRKVLDDVLADRLKRVTGVAQVSVMGGDEPEMQVLLNSARIKALNINPNTITQLLWAQNVNQPAGYLEFRQRELLIRSKGEFTGIRDIEDLVVGATERNMPVYLKDVAEVKRGHKFTRSTEKIGGKRGVFITVMKESDANTVRITKEVLKELEATKAQLPEDLIFFTLFDQGNFIGKVSTNTGTTAFVGAFLAIVLIFIFLRNFRPTFAISLAIPFSVITTFIAMWAVGYSLNIITMAGLALGVGMLVDNAIVVIENIQRHIDSGEGRKEAAAKGAKEVGMAITASTLTTVAVFLPMILATGITGQLARGMALTVTFSLFASLFVALSLIPMLASQTFRPTTEQEKKLGWFLGFRRQYLKILDLALLHRKTTVFIVLGLLAFCGALVPVSEQNLCQSLTSQ